VLCGRRRGSSLLLGNPLCTFSLCTNVYTRRQQVFPEYSSQTKTVAFSPSATFLHFLNPFLHEYNSSPFRGKTTWKVIPIIRCPKALVDWTRRNGKCLHVLENWVGCYFRKFKIAIVTNQESDEDGQCTRHNRSRSKTPDYFPIFSAPGKWLFAFRL
jgi:hypothetical protein